MTPVRALQAVLAGEHAALYIYGVLGGQVSRSAQPALAELIATGHRTHRKRRDRLTVLLTAHDTDPVAAAPAYRLPNDAATPRQLRAAAQTVEARCLGLYGQLVANSAGPDRAWALTALQQAAVDALAFGTAPSSFPGMAEPPVTEAS